MGINEMSSQQLTTFVYDPSGREIEKWLDNETRAVTSYDAAGQPLVVSNLESDNSVISRFTYTYDPIGNRAQEVRDEGTTTLTWSYDATSQLTNEELPGVMTCTDGADGDGPGTWSRECSF